MAVTRPEGVEEFVLDPAEAEARKRQQLRRVNVYQIPVLRLAGFGVVSVLLLLYDAVFAARFDARAYLAVVAAMVLYALGSWYLLFKLYDRLGKIDLGFVFLNADVFMFLVALHHTGGRHPWMPVLLLTRVADQTNTSFRRAFYFNNVIAAGLLGLLLFSDWVEGARVDWRMSSVVLVVLWLVGAYIALSARAAEILRLRTRRAVHLARDLVLELRQQAAALSLARTQAESASRAKSEFLANISHELRTPMTGILGLTELVLESELPPKQRNHLTLVQASAHSLLKLLNDLIDFARFEAGRWELQPVEFRPAEVIEDVLKTQALYAREKGLELASHIDAQVPEWVEGDVRCFRQIVVNLVGNAVKFTDSGEVRVTLAADPPAGQQVQLHLSVRDTGIGIPAEKLREIFDVFTQVDSSTTRKHGGAGLGLAITAQLAELMAGEVTVDSEIGRGSTFTFSVPVRFLVARAAEPVS
jgi:signal transduction histidine kinase